MSSLGISLELIVGTFRGVWDSLSLDDLLDPLGAFDRIVTQFGEPLSRIFAFIAVVVETVISLVLRLMNFPSDLLASIISNVAQAIDSIQRDPVGFLQNLLAALKLGFTAFFDHILTYLLQGLGAWLFRGLGQLGITLPTDFSPMSILTLVLQVLGLTIDHLWEKLGEHIGAERVAMIRGALDHLGEAWAFISDVQQRGIAAIWDYIASQLGNLWDTLLGMAQEWIMTTIVNNVVARLLSMLDPTGVMAVVNSFVAFFNAIQSAIEYLRDILEIINRYVTTLAQIAAGNITPGAQMLEQGLAAAIPIAIGFLANQVGIGNVPEKVVELIGGLRALIDRALDWLITQALRLGQAALNAITGRGRGEEPPVGPDTRTPQEKERDADAAARDADRLLAHPGVAAADVEAQFPELQRRYRLTSIQLVADQAGRRHVELAINPRRQTPPERLLSEPERVQLHVLAERWATLIRRDRDALARFRADRDDFIENPGLPDTRSGDIAERIGRPILETYAGNNGLRVIYGPKLQIVDRAGANVGGAQSELDGLLVRGNTVAEVLSTKLNYETALNNTDVTAINRSLGNYFNPRLAAMTPARSGALGARLRDAAGIDLVYEGGRMSLEDFQADYSRAGNLRYIGLSARHDTRDVPREAAATLASGASATRLTIGEMTGVTRVQLRRLVSDAIGIILGEPADARPFP
jgi:hypothetical protein